MKSPEKKFYSYWPAAGANFAHFRVLRGNLAKSLTTGRPFLEEVWDFGKIFLIKNLKNHGE